MWFVSDTAADVSRRPTSNDSEEVVNEKVDNDSSESVTETDDSDTGMVFINYFFHYNAHFHCFCNNLRNMITVYKLKYIYII